MSGHDRDSDAGDGRRDGCGDGPAAHRTILEALRDAVGNPCTARYVDPVRVGGSSRGSSTLGRADGTPPPRHRAVRARTRRARCCPAPRPLARRHVRYRRPVHAERPRRDQHPHAARGRAGRRRSHRASRTTRSPARETLTAIERRTAPQATTAGINGDFFAFATGLPSGVLMQDGQVMSPPSAYRASAGVTSDGTLDVRRVTLSGTWQGARRQAHAEPVQQAARGQRHRALHAGVGPHDAADARRRVGDPVPVPRRDPEHRPPGSGRRAPRRAAPRSRSRPAAPFSSRSAPRRPRSRRRRPSGSS